MLVCLPSKLSIQQECIQVGCVPAARRPYSGVCFPGGWGQPGLGWGGQPGPGGVFLVSEGGLPGWGVCLVWGGSAWSGGVSAWSGGCVPGPRGCVPGLGGYPSMH